MEKVGIIGLGRAGSVLAYLLKREGWDIRVVLHRTTAGRVRVKDREFPVLSLAEVVQETETLIIATPDRAIHTVAVEIGAILEAKKTAANPGSVKAALHLSGSLSSAALAPLRERGLAVGAFHPLQSLASLEQALENLPGTYFTYEGDQALAPWAASVAQRLGGKLKVLEGAEERVFYHAGACMASNFLVALAKLGIDCLEKAGFAREEARAALVPLMRGTLNNLGALPPERALTGPVARGDLETVESHARALSRELPTVFAAYGQLASIAARMAVNGGSITVRQEKELGEILARKVN